MEYIYLEYQIGHSKYLKGNIDMKEKLSIEEYEEIKKLVDSAIYVSNKKETQKYINNIKSYGYTLCGNANNILGELISYVETVSGRVANKEHWIDCVKNKLYVLGNYGVEE